MKNNKTQKYGELHKMKVDEQHPDVCNKKYTKEHVHGPNCGHKAVQHGDHIDYVVDGRLHHPHDNHSDDHGSANS